MTKIECLLSSYYGLDDDNKGWNALWITRFDPLSLAALVHFFQPETDIVNNRVMLRSPGPNDSGWMAARDKAAYGDDEELLDSFNWLEIFPFFGSVNPDGGLSDDLHNEIEQEICNMISISWDLWLHHKYPRRNFSVFLINPEESGYAWGVGYRES